MSLQGFLQLFNWSLYIVVHNYIQWQGTLRLDPHTGTPLLVCVCVQGSGSETSGKSSLILRLLVGPFFFLSTKSLGTRLVRRLYGTLIEWMSYLVNYICTCACVCATFCSATFIASFILAFFSEVVVNFASTGIWVCTRRRHH